jgi:hypothetical protein
LGTWWSGILLFLSGLCAWILILEEMSLFPELASIRQLVIWPWQHGMGMTTEKKKGL